MAEISPCATPRRGAGPAQVAIREAFSIRKSAEARTRRIVVGGVSVEPLAPTPPFAVLSMVDIPHRGTIIGRLRRGILNRTTRGDQMREAVKAAVLAVLVLSPGAAFAQAVIAGTVKDASGAVLPGVTVEATSPALIEKVRTAVTDGSGQYRIE